MADTKNALNKQVTRGELLVQTVITLIVILGVAQFTNILAAQPEQANKTATVGATGAMGAAGETGEPGEKGAKGKTGASGTAGVMGLTGAEGDDGDRGKIGLTGATGLPGVLALAYGGLSVTSQEILIETPDEWVPIPFDAAGPSSGMYQRLRPQQ